MDNGNQYQPQEPVGAPEPSAPPFETPAQAPIQAGQMSQSQLPQMQQSMQQAPGVPAPLPPAPVPEPVYAQQPMQQPFAQPSLTANQIQDNMKKRVLKIIAILTVVSLAAVSLVFFVSGMEDASLSVENLEEKSNSQATYSVPAGWSEDTVDGTKAFSNAESTEVSQATFIIQDPLRVTLTAGGVTEPQAENIVDTYRRKSNEEAVGIEVADRKKVAADGFSYAYQLDITGVADDGVTELLGLTRIYFDGDGYVHIVEVLAVRSYWDANTTGLMTLIDSYELKEE